MSSSQSVEHRHDEGNTLLTESLFPSIVHHKIMLVSSFFPHLLVVFNIGSSLRYATAYSEPYAYVIYSEKGTCSDGAVTVNGFVSDNENTVVGAKSANNLCAEEAICILDSTSPQCKELEPTGSGKSTTSISDDGLIFQCDETNTDGECHILDDCYDSSIFPSCNFILALSSTIVEQPELIQSDKTEHLHQQSYLVFYSDLQCQDFAGFKGVASGPTNLTHTSSSISCDEAISCLLAPDSEMCQNTDSLTGEVSQIYAENRNNGRDPFSCTSDNSNNGTSSLQRDTTGECQDMTNSGCMASTIHPSCHFRWTSAARFIEDPGSFLTKPKSVPSEPPSPSTQQPDSSTAFAHYEPSIMAVLLGSTVAVVLLV